MTASRKYIMRIVLLLLLFQFTAPAFLTTVAQGSMNDENGDCSYHVSHNSIVIPLLLKEKDETENKGDDFQIAYIPLIDFSDHVSVLTDSHGILTAPVSYKDHFDHHPPLFTLYGVFII